MTEERVGAAIAYRDWRLNECGFERIISLIRADNVASQRVGLEHERDVVSMEDVSVRMFSIERGS
ncbi:MAG: hypothetical protein IH914_06870 [candidate division Zixibacteria bacterium]|nr:hypothetical protein [candidate division Zixibacteria bacterium]